jgi:hypothetical protein
MNNRAMSSSEEGGSQHDMGGALGAAPAAAAAAMPQSGRCAAPCAAATFAGAQSPFTAEHAVPGSF